MSNAISITSQNFQDEVLSSQTPVLVDFWASWCGPCMMLAPIVDELAQEFAGKIKVGKVDIDAEEALAVQFGIMSIPTLLLFKNGEAVARSSGVQPKESLAEFIEQVL